MTSCHHIWQRNHPRLPRLFTSSRTTSLLLFPPCPPHHNSSSSPSSSCQVRLSPFLRANRTSSLLRSRKNGLKLPLSSDLLEFHPFSWKNKKISRRNLLLSVKVMEGAYRSSSSAMENSHLRLKSHFSFSGLRYSTKFKSFLITRRK